MAVEKHIPGDLSISRASFRSPCHLDGLRDVRPHEQHPCARSPRATLAPCGWRSPHAYRNCIDVLLDLTGRARSLMRVDRLIHGKPGDHRKLTNGVARPKVDVGRGYWVDDPKRGSRLLLLLIGGGERVRTRTLRRQWVWPRRSGVMTWPKRQGRRRRRSRRSHGNAQAFRQERSAGVHLELSARGAG